MLWLVALLGQNKQVVRGTLLSKFTDELSFVASVQRCAAEHQFLHCCSQFCGSLQMGLLPLVSKYAPLASTHFSYLVAKSLKHQAPLLEWI